MVLAARCPKLAEVLAADPGKQELYISGMDSATLAEFLHFLYTDTTRQGLDVGTDRDTHNKPHGRPLSSVADRLSLTLYRNR